MNGSGGENPHVVVLRALDFAAKTHAGQTRKGPRDEPYINHVVEVARLIAEATDGADPGLIAAGALHDVLEDSDASQEDLAQAFGADIAALVAEVTDIPGVGEAERRRHQVEAAPGLSARARLIKMADKTSNIEEMAADPPPAWSTEEIRAYVQWGVDVVAGCRGLNDSLEKRFDAAVVAARARLGGG